MSDFIELFSTNVEENDNLYTATIKSGLKNRILILNEEITDNIIENIIIHIFYWNMEDSGLPKDKRKPIKIIINSPGGDVFVAQSLISVIENSTTPIIGIGVGFVASAAYYILLACPMRIGFKNTIVLMHDGDVSISSSGSKSKNVMNFFDHLDERTKKFVLEKTTMTEEFYDQHFSEEFYFYANEGGLTYGVFDKIIGEDISFDEIFCN